MTATASHRATAPQVLHLHGELCIAELPGVQRSIDAAIDAGARELVIDLAGATLLTAAGIRVLASTERRLLALGGGLRLRNPPLIVRRVLGITGFDRLVDRALAS